MYEEQISSPQGTEQPEGQPPKPLDPSETIERFLSTANVDHVYGQAVQSGESTVIPTAEVFSMMGFGEGHGTGPEGKGGGSGSGGFGRTFSRPVAVVVARQGDVDIRPVYDFTKIILAVVTTWGFMVMTLARMSRGPRRS